MTCLGFHGDSRSVPGGMGFNHQLALGVVIILSHFALFSSSLTVMKNNFEKK